VRKSPNEQGHKENGPPHVGWVLIFTVALVLLPNREVICAQTTLAQTPAAQPPATPTLHVYENLKQVPVLVLTSDYRRMKPLDTSKFRLSLDSGPSFRPTHVRQEGDDPISLAILIDASKPYNDMLPQLSQAIAALAPDYLHPHNHVSIYVLDCTLIRTAYDAQANRGDVEAVGRQGTGVVADPSRAEARLRGALQTVHAVMGLHG
jgi:hypothetical protein